MIKDNEILAQEEEYWFPYHYVASFHDGRFRQHFVDTWGVNYVATLSLIVERIKILQPYSLVDIGCGDGRLTREISFIESIARLCGIDFSSRAINLAKAMNQDRPQIEFCAIDIAQPNSLGTFEVAILMEVFEHIPIEQCCAFIKSVRCLLKPQGKLLLTVPHANKPLEYKHFQHFTSKSLLKYFEEDFMIDQVMPFERMALSRKILGNYSASPNRVMLIA